MERSRSGQGGHVANVPIGSALTLVATGKYLGEGFDEPRLDTLVEEVVPDSINIIYDKSNFLPLFINDVMSSARQVVVVSPFVSKQRALFMMKQLESVLQKNGKVIIVTRPVDDFKEKDRAALQEVFDLLKTSGADLIARSHIHLKFAVVDQRIVWYGSINLLSFGSTEENIMRTDSPNIANELLRSITKE
ncbi:MAG: hypothetical protein GYA36_09990 [Veillonellaceae bacterium]|nr:hypothetical protein [Veillonellaceae bacterium]